MANRETTFTSNGQTYRLRMGHTGFYFMEQKTGENIEKFITRIAADVALSLRDLQNLLWAGLEVSRQQDVKANVNGARREPWEFSDVLELLDDSEDQKAIFTAVRDALLKSLPQPELVGKEPAKNPQ